MARWPYPVENPEDWKAMRRLGAIQRLMLRLRTRRYRRRAPNVDRIKVFPEGAEPLPLAPEDLALVCVVRNARPYLASFLVHYRALGVTRFVILDDRSDDGTREVLAGEADVDLYGSNVPFAESHSGRAWRDRLFERYGRGRWYVNVDADEFLLFPDCETRPLTSLIADLERAGLKRCLAPMLDLYPPGRLADGVFDPGRHRMPSEVSSLIDGTGYTIGPEKFTLSVRGGPRARLFGNDIRLTKFPVIFVDGKTREGGASVHGPLPLERNFSAVNAVLLHYKFSSRSVREFRDFAARGSHFGGAIFYKSITANVAFDEDLSLAFDGSIQVNSSMDLVRRGFMEDLRTRRI